MIRNEVEGRYPAAGYSSTVQLFLLNSGEMHRLAEIGPGYVTLREAASLQAGISEVLMSVDGKERRWSVTLSANVTAKPFDTLVIS